MTRQVDRIVFDVSQLAPAASSVLDVLRQTPGVDVSGEALSLIGKGAVIVLINDQRVRLHGTALLSLLRSYPQSALSEIQILTTPPAKYEAEGNAGIISILLKKSKQDYFGGSIAPTIKASSKYVDYGAAMSLHYKRGKTTASLQLNGNRDRSYGLTYIDRVYPAQHFYSTSETRLKGS